MAAASVTRVMLLRHGVTPMQGLYCGASDPALTDQGWQQMHEAIKPLAYDLVISSPRQRCAEFARALSDAVVMEAAFAEIDFGAWEGLSAEAIEQRDADTWSRYLEQWPLLTPPHGEAIEQFETRVASAWRDMLERYAGRSLLLITHGGVMRSLLRQLLGLSWQQIGQWQIGYAALSCVDVKHDASPYASLRSHSGGA